LTTAELNTTIRLSDDGDLWGVIFNLNNCTRCMYVTSTLPDNEGKIWVNMRFLSLLSMIAEEA